MTTTSSKKPGAAASDKNLLSSHRSNDVEGVLVTGSVFGPSLRCSFRAKPAEQPARPERAVRCGRNSRGQAGPAITAGMSTERLVLGTEDLFSRPTKVPRRCQGIEGRDKESRPKSLPVRAGAEHDSQICARPDEALLTVRVVEVVTGDLRRPASDRHENTSPS